MTNPHEIEERDFGRGPVLWDADPDVCCAAFQLGACAHTEAWDEAEVDRELEEAERVAAFEAAERRAADRVCPSCLRSDWIADHRDGTCVVLVCDSCLGHTIAVEIPRQATSP